MLGDKIGELTGKVTGTRVLPGDDFRYVKMEISFQEAGKLFGIDATDVGTYTIFERVPGQIYGEGQGITQAGEDGAIWNGHGVGRMTGQGMASSMRFSLAFQADPSGKLGRLNGVLVIGEHETDDQGNVKTTIWEWK